MRFLHTSGRRRAFTTADKDRDSLDR
jgi:hypothetical protein